MVESIYYDSLDPDDGAGSGGLQLRRTSVDSVYPSLDPIYSPEPITLDPDYDVITDREKIEPTDPVPVYENTYQEPEPLEPLKLEPITVFPDQPEPVQDSEPIYTAPEPIIIADQDLKLVQPDPVETTQTTESTETMTKTVRIVDDLGTPVPGAHVFFDQENGTTANFNGQASISSEDPTVPVFISHIGFTPRSFIFKNLPETVTLTPGETLEEVIVDAPSKAAQIDSKMPKYLLPAVGGLAFLLILLSLRKKKAKKVTL